MKLINNIAFFCFLATLVFSCKKDGDLTVARTDTSSDLTASATTLVLKKADESKDAVALSWKAADFGYAASVTQVLQIAMKGTNFASPKEIVLTNRSTSIKYTVLDFNALVLTLGLPFNRSTDLELRVKSTISASFPPSYSSVVSMAVTPYELVSFIYVPGDYQGWNVATADSLRSPTGNGIYSGIINFPAKAGATFEFKITPAKSWNTAYGDAGNGTLSTSGGNLKAPAAGSYRLTADLNANTWKMEVESWGIIGAATPNGWGSDTPLTYDNGKAVWTGTLTLSAGEFKFRKNASWDAGNAFGAGAADGLLSATGANINLTVAGTYRLVLDTEALTYTLTKI